MTLSLEQLTQAFEDWETNYRADPEGFLSHDETAAMAVADVSESRAIYFNALLRQRAQPEKPGPKDPTDEFLEAALRFIDQDSSAALRVVSLLFVQMLTQSVEAAGGDPSQSITLDAQGTGRNIRIFAVGEKTE